jgi:hypothetical protein
MGSRSGFTYGVLNSFKALRLSDGAYSCTRRIDGMHRIEHPLLNTIRAGRKRPGYLHGWPGRFAFSGAFPHVRGPKNKGLTDRDGL